MKEKIENKIEEIIQKIIDKDASEITYEEYKILDAKLKDIIFEESSQEHKEQMAELISKTFNMPTKPATIE